MTNEKHEAKTLSCPTCNGEVKSVWRVAYYNVDYYGRRKGLPVEELSEWGTPDEARADLPNHAIEDGRVKDRWHPIGIDQNSRGFVFCDISHAYRSVALSAIPPQEVSAPALSSFQSRVKPWLDTCFGAEIAGDKVERNHRFIEEALELVQSTGCTQSEAHQLVDYVYGRDVGEPTQEVGGVMNTLAALCLAHGMDMDDCGETELARVWTKVDVIRAKQKAKPKHLPLPMSALSEEPQ